MRVPRRTLHAASRNIPPVVASYAAPQAIPPASIPPASPIPPAYGVGTPAAQTAGATGAGQSGTAAVTGKSQKAIIITLIVAIIVVAASLTVALLYRMDIIGPHTTTTAQTSQTSGQADSGKSSGSDSSKTKNNDSETKEDTTNKDDSSDTDQKSKSDDNASGSMPDKMTSYYNDRFYYQVDVPADYARGPEPQNDDGLAFNDAATDIKITASGHYNALFHSPQEELDFLKSNIGVTPAYETVAGQSVYLSYEKDGYIYYQREIVTDEKIASVLLKYPTSQRSIGDQLAEKIPPTLKFVE